MSRDWYTPPEVMGLIRPLFKGKNWTDVCSDEDAQAIVKAPSWWAAAGEKWPGNVFMNPPNGQAKEWFEKALYNVREFRDMNVSYTYVVLGYRIEYIKYQQFDFALFPPNRIKFIDPETDLPGAPPRVMNFIGIWSTEVTEHDFSQFRDKEWKIYRDS